MTSPETYQIAIDGPSGSGKSTLAKGLAAALGFVYIDTGALYRAVGLYAAMHGVSSEEPEGVIPLLPQLDLQMRLENGGSVVYLDGKPVGQELRTSEASRYASQVSKLPAVRAFLLETQRAIARKNHVIMDGRDIGTVILPQAQCKLYLAPSPEERATRRYAELVAAGEQITLEQVRRDILWRDENDSKREASPAKPAPDAVFLDNSTMSQEETLQAALAIVQKKIPVAGNRPLTATVH